MWSVLQHGHVTPDIQWVGRYMGPRAVLDTVVKGKICALARN
jgi:hypothetical protein